jgi:hypothetical protein
MPETIYESDSEFEEYLRTGGSSHFGSRTCAKKMMTKKSANLGSSSTSLVCSNTPSEGDDEEVAGSTRNVRLYGSGSSPTGCHLHNDDKASARPINLLEEKLKDEGNSINNVEAGWEFVSILIDSGSTETVAPKDSLKGYELTSTDWSETGKGYTAANGTDIPNLGEKVVKGQAANGGMWCSMTFQICEVTKPLGSVSRICQAGSRVVFGPPEEGSYIEHIQTGKKTMLRQSKGLYYLDVWVAPSETSTFTRQGSSM